MKITIQDLGRFAAEFLHVLERENISSTQDLEKIIMMGGRKFMINVQESLIIMPMPSQSMTFASNMTYDVQGIRAPIQLRINRQEDYTKSFINFAGMLPGYSRFAVDGFGNIAQEALWMTSEFARSMKHLKELKSYAEK